MKELFAKQALSDADDFDGNIYTLFNYIHGVIQSWESTGIYGGSDERNSDGKGNHKKEVESTYALITSE